MIRTKNTDDNYNSLGKRITIKYLQKLNIRTRNTNVNYYWNWSHNFNDKYQRLTKIDHTILYLPNEKNYKTAQKDNDNNNLDNYF